jgi:uncharacterized membrane protein
MSLSDERTVRLAAAALSAIGIGIAIYIALAESGGGAPVCLAGGHGCQTVADSSYSHLLGINVAVIGIAGYVALLAAALWPGDWGRLGGLTLALIGFGFSLYLTYLELFVIDAVCQWCVASAAVMTLLLIVNLIRTLRFGGSELAAPAVPALREEPTLRG